MSTENVAGEMQSSGFRVPGRNGRLLVLFGLFTSFARWEQHGFLSRQVELYRRYSQRFDKIFIKSYETRKIGGISDNVEHISFPKIPFAKYLYLLFGGLRKCYAVEYVEVEDVSAILAVLPYKLRGSRILLYHKYDLAEAIRSAGIPILPWLAQLVQILAFRMADGIAVTSVTQAKRVARHTKAKLYLLPNHVDTERFAPNPEVAKIPNLLVYVGRLHQQKNISALLEALSQLPDYRLWIIGDGPLYNHVSAVKQEGNLTNVELKGVVAHGQLHEYLNQVEAFILVSFSEGHPKALIEAMACGLPTIGSNVTGIHDVIVNGETGFLCDTSAEGIKEAILKLFADREEMEQMGRRARELAVANYSVQKIVDLRIRLIRGDPDLTELSFSTD